MSLEYAILGVLQYKPASGYNIKKILDTSINHFWYADQSQIYRTLSKMEKDEWINMDLIIQSNKPSSKVYHITEKGKEEFLNWLNSPMQMVQHKIPWLMQFFFAARLSDEAIINILEQVSEQIKKRINVNTSNNLQENKAYKVAFTERDLFFMELTHDYGLMIHQSILQWVEKVIAQIKKTEHPTCGKE
ncbi:MAG: PadR family transcriptional regulator [Anaerovorax sp.]|nr:PadR family transcriptional regulator [Anaerovorax sp.]